jgi:hypothetical protein
VLPCVSLRTPERWYRAAGAALARAAVATPREPCVRIRPHPDARSQALRVVFPRGADWLGFKLLSLARLFRLIKIQRKIGSHLASPWVHLGAVAGLYLLCSHMLACLLFFVGRWQLKTFLVGGSSNDWLGMCPPTSHTPRPLSTQTLSSRTHLAALELHALTINERLFLAGLPSTHAANTCWFVLC